MKLIEQRNAIEHRRLYLDLYALGAVCVFLSALSLGVWLITGIGIPFHPVFAAGVGPLGIVLIVMAFLIRDN